MTDIVEQEPLVENNKEDEKEKQTRLENDLYNFTEWIQIDEYQSNGNEQYDSIFFVLHIKEKRYGDISETKDDKEKNGNENVSTTVVDLTNIDIDVDEEEL